MSVLQSKKIPVLKTDDPFSFCDSAEVVSKYPSWNADQNSYVMDPVTMPKQVYTAVCSGTSRLAGSVIALAGAAYTATF